MTEKKPLSSKPSKHIDATIPPFSIESEFDLARLRKKILAVADPKSETPWGIDYEVLEFHMRIAITKAKRAYKGYRHISRIEKDLKELDALCQRIVQLIEDTPIRDYFSMSLLDSARNDLLQISGRVPVEELLELYKMAHESLGRPDHERSRLSFFDQEMILDFPFDSLSLSAELVGRTAEAQLNNFEVDYGPYKAPRRPDCEALALAVFDLHRERGREDVRFPGGETGPCAELFLELCRIAEIPPGCPRQALRKFENLKPN